MRLSYSLILLFFCAFLNAESHNSSENEIKLSNENPTEVLSCVLGTVYISEAHGKGEPEDYIEIYNSGDTDCYMLGFQLDDEQPFGDFTFADVTIPAGDTAVMHAHKIPHQVSSLILNLPPLG